MEQGLITGSWMTGLLGFLSRVPSYLYSLGIIRKRKTDEDVS